MDRFIKASTITFGGYIYQNLIGLEFVCNWLEDPGRYEWVKFEADEDEIPKGLDDIVAKSRVDGKLVLLQVKFTVDPSDENNLITWDWLLSRKPKGKSLIQKWSAAFWATGVGNISEAALVTNRRPDRHFSACLDKSSCYVDLTKVSGETKAAIIEQIGSEEMAVEFLQSFEFRHSHKGYLSLRRTLLDSYVPNHTTYHGWHVLFTKAVDWALRKNFPLPDGKITLDLIRGVLDSRRPEPISESFRVPDGYCPPDDKFSEDFIDRITSSSNSLSIIWGSPGQGKSTYLSFVCQKLDELSVPYIRHHYFIELSDESDRFSMPEVANSLMAQMENIHALHVQGLQDTPEHLREWVAACGRGYAEENKKFIVIIDGLDHVWRENDHDKRPLESLFSQLLPTADNVTVVLGTQRVADEQLPSQLLKFSEDDNWVELPRMSLTSIRAWLEVQLSAHRFEIPDRCYPSDNDPLTALAESFQRISDGHPLHLTYSFEAVVREQRLLTPDIVEQLPDCPGGDIKRYYRSLWQNLSYQAKDALHLVAATKFIWPPFGLDDCLRVRPGELNREISHLFYPTEAGNLPFHGSVLAFVREENEHEQRVSYLMPSVVEWLETKAPEYHRWGWLWLLKARIGAKDELVTNPTRDWIIDSLARGYPKSQIVEILSAAERVAFSSYQFARAVRLRWLKIRLLNGTQYQIQNFDRLYECTLTLSEDDYPLRVLSAVARSASIDELHLLGRQYLLMNRIEDAAECQEQIRRRINDRLKAGAYDRNSLKKMSEQFLELAAVTQKYEPRRLLQSLLGFKELSVKLFRFFLSQLTRHADLTLLTKFLHQKIPRAMRLDLELTLLRLAGTCHARFHEWHEFEKLGEHPLGSCWALLYAPNKAKEVPFDIVISKLDEKYPGESLQDADVEFLHRLFFHALAECLRISGAVPDIKVPEFKTRLWLNTAVHYILKIASSIGAVLARGNSPSLTLSYRLIADLKPPAGYDDLRDYTTLRRAVLLLTKDVFLLTSLRSANERIDERDWIYITNSRHFLFSDWLEQYIGSGHKLLSDDVVKNEIEKLLAKESGKINQFNERAQNYLELCELALFHGLHDLARRLSQKVLSCVMGYGSHKDMTMSYILDAVTAISQHDLCYGKDAMRRLCPVVANIDLITDGDDMRHIKFEMAELLLKLLPASFTMYFEFLMQNAEWYEAEQVLSILLEHEKLDTPIMQAVTAGIWDEHTVGALRTRARNGEKAALDIINLNAAYFGTAPEDLSKERFSGSSDIEESHGIDVTAYAPDSLQTLLEELRKRQVYAGERKAVREWFQYWITQSRELELIRGIEPILDDGNIPYGVEGLLDDIFKLSLKLEGKKKAYRWLVVAQIHRHGWSEYYAKEDALTRFSAVAAFYPDRWQGFILDTSKSPYKQRKKELVIPSDRLVQLLLILGKVSEAKEVAEEMISTVIDEVSDQPLEMPYWFLGE